MSNFRAINKKNKINKAKRKKIILENIKLQNLTLTVVENTEACNSEKMDKLKCCRICLIMDVKMYHIGSNNLKHYYDLMVQDSCPNTMPSYVCYECTSFLYKCNLFREKCKRGQNVLHNIDMITSEEIEKIDREGNNLKSTLQYVQLHNITNVDNEANANCDKETKFESHLHITNSIDKIAYINNVDYEEEYYDSEGISGENDNFEIVNSGYNKNPHKRASTKLKKSTNKINNVEEFYDSEDIIPLKDTFLEKVNSDVNKNKNIKENSNTNSAKNLHKIGSTELKHNEIMSLRNIFPNAEECYNSEDISLEDNVLRKVISDANKNNTINKVKHNKIKNPKNQHIIFDKDKWSIVVLNEEDACREYNLREQTSRDAPYRCDLCFKGFSSYNIMKRHLPIHSEERGSHECGICKRRFRWRTKLNCHKNEHLIRYHCLKCSKIFTNRSVALIHEKCHDGKYYTCSLCNAEFKIKSSYYSHVRLKHRSEFVCEMCGESFVSEIGVNQHRKRMHSMDTEDMSEESFRCEKCDKNFTNKSAYVKHISNSSVHCDDTEGDKEISCEIKKSLFKVSNISNTEPATCDQCGDIFKSALSVLKHVRRIHAERKGRERIVCEICGVYVLKNNARNHRNNHTKTVQYPCATCGRVFNSAANRYRHMVLHTGQKPYSCKVCSKSYTQRSNLQVHYNTHHLKLPARYRRRHRE